MKSNRSIPPGQRPTARNPVRKGGYSLLLLLLLLTACEKWELEERPFPEAVTLEAEGDPSVVSNARFNGEITGLPDGDYVAHYGHVWSTDSTALSLENNQGQTFFDMGSNGPFQSEATGLALDRTHYYRAFIVYQEEVTYGVIRSFQTGSLDFDLRITKIFGVDRENLTVIVLADYSDLPIGLGLQSFGVTWGKDTLPEIASDPFLLKPGSTITESTTSMQFSDEISLFPGQNFLRPLIVIGNEAYYGEGRTYFLGDVWVRLADLEGEPREEGVSFAIGNKGYVGLGTNGNLPLGDFWAYDPTADTWDQRASPPFPGFPGRVEAVGLAVEGSGYVGLGADTSNYHYDFYKYVPLENSWVAENNFEGWGAIGAFSFSIESKGYVGTGWLGNPGEYSRDFWEYDPATGWTRKPNFGGTGELDGTRIVDLVGFAIGSKGYAGTGWNNGGSRSEFWEYDPANGTWTQKADFGGGPRSGAVGFAIGDKGYIGTGTDGSELHQDFWEYDPTDNEWTRIADFRGGRREGAVGFSIGSRGYIGTGWSGTELKNDFWVYYPNSN